MSPAKFSRLAIDTTWLGNQIANFLKQAIKVRCYLSLFTPHLSFLHSIKS
jgi:hypothetical protein